MQQRVPAPTAPPTSSSTRGANSALRPCLLCALGVIIAVISGYFAIGAGWAAGPSAAGEAPPYSPSPSGSPWPPASPSGSSSPLRLPTLSPTPSLPIVRRLWRGLAGNPLGTLVGITALEVLVSQNGARSWSAAPSLPPAAWTSVAASANGRAFVVVAAGGEAYSSSDGGASWAAVAPLLALALPWTDVEFSPTGAGVAVASWANATSGGAYKSADGGVTWAALKCPPARYSAAAIDDSGRVVFLGALGSQRLRVSRDGGATFEELPDFPGDWSDISTSADAKYTYGVREADSDLTSNDYGAVWRAGGASIFARYVVATPDGYALRLAAEASVPAPRGDVGGRIFASLNWTAWTWVSQQRFWTGLAVASSGKAAVAVAYNDTAYGADPFSITSQTWEARA